MAGDNSPAMKNKYIRLFVALTKLMTAEKMRLDRFCQHGEVLSYRVVIPNGDDLETLSKKETTDITFMFDCTLEHKTYRFREDTIDSRNFLKFERHLSEFLNTLWDRKNEYDKAAYEMESINEKLNTMLTEDERKLLATHIDARTSTVLRMLGVVEN